MKFLQKKTFKQLIYKKMFEGLSLNLFKLDKF
nr:MAG TPA: hypothetical protein [Bacteriophage sp.]